MILTNVSLRGKSPAISPHYHGVVRINKQEHFFFFLSNNLKITFFKWSRVGI